MLVHVVPYRSIILNIQFEIRDGRKARSICIWLRQRLDSCGGGGKERRTEDCTVDFVSDNLPPFLRQIFCHGTLLWDFVSQKATDGAELVLILSPFVRILECLRAIIQLMCVFQQPGEVSIAINFTGKIPNIILWGYTRAGIGVKGGGSRGRVQ